MSSSQQYKKPSEYHQTLHDLKCSHMQLNAELYRVKKPYNQRLVNVFVGMTSSQRQLIRLIMYTAVSILPMIRLFVSVIVLCFISNIGYSCEFVIKCPGKDLTKFSFFELWGVIRLCLQIYFDNNAETGYQFERILQKQKRQKSQRAIMAATAVDEVVPAYSIFSQEPNAMGIEVKGMVMSNVQYIGRGGDVNQFISEQRKIHSQKQLERARFQQRVKDCHPTSLAILTSWVKRMWSFNFHVSNRFMTLRVHRTSSLFWRNVQLEENQTGKMNASTRFSPLHQVEIVIRETVDDMIIETLKRYHHREHLRLALIACNSKLMIKTTCYTTRDDNDLFASRLLDLPDYLTPKPSRSKELLLRTTQDPEQRHALIHDLPFHDLLHMGKALLAELVSEVEVIPEFHSLRNWFRFVAHTLHLLLVKIQKQCDEYDYGLIDDSSSNNTANIEAKLFDLLRMA